MKPFPHKRAGPPHSVHWSRVPRGSVAASSVSANASENRIQISTDNGKN